MVDEDAGELIADGAVHERGRDGRVDAAGEPADDPARLPTCSRGPLGGLVDEGLHGPRAGAAADALDEVREDATPPSVCATSGWNWSPRSAAR